MLEFLKAHKYALLLILVLTVSAIILSLNPKPSYQKKTLTPFPITGDFCGKAKCRAGLGADQNTAVIMAMGFGDKKMLSKETRQAYSKAGTSHLLALSGMHIGIIYGILWFFFGRRWLLGRLLAVATVWLYVLFVGAPASAVRAASMLTLLSVVTIDGKRRLSWRAIVTVALFMIVINPSSIHDIGFQLSFLAIFGIYLVNSIEINTLLPSHGRGWGVGLLRWLYGMLSISLGAQITTAPLVWYYFGYVSIWGMLTNIVAIPIATLMLYGICFSMAVSWWPWMQNQAIDIVYSLASILNYLVSIF